MTGMQRRRLLGVTLFVFTSIGALLYLLHLVGFGVTPGQDHYRVKATVPTAVSLAQNADIRQAGVVIGQIKAVERGPKTTTVLDLEIDSEHAPVYRDATLLVRAKSIAEENYLELNPGSPRAGKVAEGGMLPPDRSLEAFQNDDVFSIFDRLRRRDLRRAVGGLRPGLGHGRDLNRTIESSRAFADDASPFARTLAQDRRRVGRLVDSFGRVTSALGERRDSIQTLTRQAKVTAEAVAARDRYLRSTLEQLPSFLAQTRQTSDRLGGFATSATPVMRDLRVAGERLTPTVRELGPAARAGRKTVTQLDRFSRASGPALRRLRPFSRAASELVPPLSGTLREVNPVLAYLDPYWRELSTWFATQGSHTQNKDEVGNTARVLLPISRSNFPGVVPPELEDFVDKLATDAGADSRGSNPFLAPGEAGNSKRSFSGTYPKLQREPPYGH